MKDTPDRILKSALELMQDKGFKSVTIKDIAEASEVSEMTVFRQFGTKRGVLEAAIGKYSYVPNFKKIFDEELSWNLELDLEYIATSYLTLMRKNQPIFLIAIQIRKNMPEVLSAISNNTVQLKELLKTYFSEMQNNKRMGDGNPEVLSMVFLTTLYGFFSTNALFPDHFISEMEEDFIKSTVQSFCYGVKI